MFIKQKKKKPIINVVGLDVLYDYWKSSFLDKNFVQILKFLEEFLLNKFYNLGNSFIDILKSEELTALVNEFNLINGSHLNFSNKKITVNLNSYLNNKFIFFIEINYPQEFFNVNGFTERIFPFKCFACFDLVNPTKNVFFRVYKYKKVSAELTEEFFYLETGKKIVLDDTGSYYRRPNYFSQITIQDIEDLFGAKNLNYSIDKIK